ncbi:MAG: phosphate ABC transporter permease PstA [Gammaproteobacteria bacterium]|nr:phosphate ABC transporter permease PstA [Gammaproteobacteria bacterium]MCI0591448.1 phosphate ABC transporter permease PstA [Gammaproteobacteria bacterium]
MREWIRSGSPWVWLNAGAVSVCLVMVLGLLLLIAVRGLGHFWPSNIVQLHHLEEDGSAERLIGEFVDHEKIPREGVAGLSESLPSKAHLIDRYLLKIGNRDLFGRDFRWIVGPSILNSEYPKHLTAVERHEWGNLYGYLIALKERGEVIHSDQPNWDVLQERLARKQGLFKEIRHLEKDVVGAINYRMERLRLKERGLELDGVLDRAAYRNIEVERTDLQGEYDQLTKRLADLYDAIGRDGAVFEIADGREVEIPISKIVRVYQPNRMDPLEKLRFYGVKLWEFVSDEPREANTEGGILPAIFGTALMVMIMSVFVTPFGVVAAVYLREYAKQGPLTRLIRIAVNNLAGVPSVVYGVFGLGFFVYVLGGSIDQLFFREALPGPTFGTPGLMWASLTLAILTVPVVIVATEEGLSRIPRAIREGSLALGATKAETLWRTVLPMTAPAMMTGLILAVARAAGEVAPLMLVGVVKLAPSLAMDGNFPYLHLDRKFMHLGFHIYDVGFQSPNVEAARPLVYATALLLVLLIIVLNLAAIHIRNRLREKYNAAE